MLPNFLIIGAMKAGTTSLHQYLRCHQQVFMSKQKEPRYFVPERIRMPATPEEQKTQDVGWYERLFMAAGGAIAIGEASVDYTAHPEFRGVPERIAHLLPDVRLVYVVRDPIDRIRSQYLNSGMWDPVEKAVLRPRYLDRSRYAMQIEQYMRWFSREQLLVITSEALRDRRAETVRRVYGFLGVNPDWNHPLLNNEYHTTVEKSMPWQGLRRVRSLHLYGRVSPLIPRPLKDAARARLRQRTKPNLAQISDELRARLENELRPDVIALYQYMDPDFDGWGIAPLGKKVAC